MNFDLLDPVLNVFKGLPFVDCIGEYDTHGSPIVSLSDSFKLFLASSIPNLEPNFVLADDNGLDFEVNAYSSEMRSHEVVITKLEQHICLANAAVAYY